MGSHADADPTHAVDGLVRAIRDLTSDPNYKLVADVFSEFLFLKDHNHRLSMSHRETMEEYRKFRNELEATKDKIEKEKSDLETIIQEKKQEIVQLSAVRTALEADLHDTRVSLELEKKNAAEAAETAAKKAADAAEAALKELTELQARKEAELAELQTRKDTELAELQTSKETELAALQTSKETELADLQASKESELAALQSSKETELADLQASKEAALADLQTAREKDIADLTATKDGEIADLTAKKDGEIADLEAAKAAVEQAKKEAEEAAAAAAEVAAQEISALTEAKTGLEEVKANNEAEIATLKDNVASLEEAKAGLEEVKANNEGEIATLKDNITNLEEEKKKVEEALAAANAEIESLNATVAQKNTEIESLQESLRAAEEQIASLQQTVEEKNAEIDDLHGKLKDEGERADKAIAHGNDLQIRLDETEQTLEVTSGRLADLEQYRVVLHEENEDHYVTVLDKIWTTIVTLVEGTFRPDIDESILQDPSCWSNLRSSPYLKHATQLQIPLPQSNSPAAKGMRISAVLAVLSRALHRHIFRPVYLFDDDDEPLVKFLRGLEDEDSAREAHLRATLLNMLPDRQMEQGARRVKTVVREVSWLVQHLLSALQFEAFCSGLEDACRLACEQWMRIQMAQLKIEPYFGPPYDDYDWQVLELPEFSEGLRHHMDDDSGTMSGAMSASMPNGTDNGEDAVADGPLETVEAAPAEGSAEADAAEAQDAEALEHGGHDIEGGASIQEEMEEYDDGEIEPEEILLVVWPSMCSVEGGDLVSITQGLVISKEQARPALEEVRARPRMMARPGSRRARTMSMPGQSRGNSPTRARVSVFPQSARSPAPGEVAGEGGPDDG
ncbi:hypothetical protein QBC34DRAFT_443217 [Podospora aff. communis PSN243]|uniref:Uncharacterized protein n=1 Tax=Podospora aff. communis PSN243 TaxID=3040156 RepID=A0AAV9G554_9PEZI|nr:hypothetical protein QBC34DRAFT_443217 [Podospora aff. communis PSN243]